ncbi:MAG: nickel pincer cofactor biosynthesis protein LarC [Gemmatimonadota bacterium]
MPRALFDPFSGISGDMVLGAFLGVGLPVEFLRDTIATLGIEAHDIRVSTARRGGVEAWRVEIPEERHAPERHLADVLAILDRAPLDPRAREIARRVFERLARAEAAVHGSDPEHVHFHEVGAVDSIADIAGAAAAFVEMGIHEAYTRAVALGRGWIRAAHGRLPVPAPATLRLLEGCPVVDAELDGECVTPTGAALLAELTGGRPAPGEFRPLRSGFGAGARDPEDRPNCLRLILIADDPEPAALFLLQADVDDLSPELVPDALQAILDAGALDAWAHAVSMKKGRPGLRLEALAPAARRAQIAHALFTHTTTIGLRAWPVDREILPREVREIDWRGFRIRVKRAILPDGTFRLKPEYEDVTQVARALGLSPLACLQELHRDLGTG